MCTLLLFKARCFGDCLSQVQVFKTGVPIVGYRLFVSQGKALDFEFPADCGLLNRGWSLWWNQVSAYPPYLDVALFLFADVKQLLS